MSEFSSRIEAQRAVLKIVNDTPNQAEQLFALSGKAIQRWSNVNGINPSRRIVRLLDAASAHIFVMANHSDDPIAGTYIINKEQLAELESLIRDEVKSPR